MLTGLSNVGNRGQDTIVVFENVDNKLKEIQTISTEGTDPRDFALSKDNKFAVELMKHQER